MEALFSTTFASYEAWIMILCVLVFSGIYITGSINLIQRIYTVLKPGKPQGVFTPTITHDAIAEVTSPILEPIAREEIEAYEAEKAKAEEKHEQEVIESEIFEEKILEEIQQTEDTNNIEMVKKMVDESEEKEETLVEKSISLGKLSNTDNLEESRNSEDTLQQDAIEIESELQEEVLDGGEKVEPIAVNEVSVPSSEAISDLDYTVRVQASITDREKIEELTDTIKTSDDSEEEKEEATTTEESFALPITASISETKIETKKSNESQYSERLYTIVSEVKTLLARGLPQEARALIIEGLSLDKNNRELNLILGSIYESERQAQKAEYIYKDLALVYPGDGEILERLANILIIEKRYDLALEIYKKIISLSPETEGSLYIMAHLSHELGHNEELYAYARRYQKNWPNNPDILTLLAQAEIALGERQSAIQTLIKLKNLTPYNNEIMETIAKLTMEEELAGNFGSEKY